MPKYILSKLNNVVGMCATVLTWYVMWDGVFGICDGAFGILESEFKTGN